MLTLDQGLLVFVLEAITDNSDAFESLNSLIVQKATF